MNFDKTASIKPAALLIGCFMLSAAIGFDHSMAQSQIKKSTIRFATFNTALNRNEANGLVTELKSGECEQAGKIAEVIQRVRPDVILLNEVDFDEQHSSVKLFEEKYLAVSQNGQTPIAFEYSYCNSVNTGIPSSMDLDSNGKIEGPNDAFGFGRFPGQYGMAILSNYPIETEDIRTFQKFLWKDMPEAAWPMISEGDKHYYSESIRQKFRLSSKSHWDVPIEIKGHVIHFLVAHPTPPVFDGPEDKNGCRNHDEIRFFADYIDTAKSDYIYDDNGNKGGLKKGDHFVIAGDMNADPLDGDSRETAINLLLEHPLISNKPIPNSEGAVEAAKLQGQRNSEHKGDPANDTGDFSDGSVGNLRIDYVLPSKTLKVSSAGVFWPKKGQPGCEAAEASDHRLVWIDVNVNKSKK